MKKISFSIPHSLGIKFKNNTRELYLFNLQDQDIKMIKNDVKLKVLEFIKDPESIMKIQEEKFYGQKIDFDPPYLKIIDSSSNHITHNHEYREALIAINYVDKNCNKRTKVITVYWCELCQVYFTFSISFQLQMELYDIPIFSITTLLLNENNGPWKEYFGFRKESILYHFGYRVGLTNGKNSKIRHKILTSIITNEILTSGQVINHLEHLIRFNGEKENMSFAVLDWMEDIRFVNKIVRKKLDSKI